MDFSRIKLLINTVKYLKFKQIAYRVLYAIRKKFVKKEYAHELKKTVDPLKWLNNIQNSTSYLENGEFRFLNITHKFQDKIDWNYNSYGKLWTYNLNYFDFLFQPNIKQSESIMLIKDYVVSAEVLKDGFEPYPTSLRCINWVKYLSKENIQDEAINKSLYNQYFRLIDNLEYHLLGNHLLENGFSLLFGAYYFKNDLFYSKAKMIIEEELSEQVLKDGAHFELSPMYHQIILVRLLDCINLVKNNKWVDDNLLDFLKQKASEMQGWLLCMTYQNGSTPHVNDATFSISSSTNTIVNYAKDLELNTKSSQLSDSGYRKWKTNDIELFMDVGNIGPDYIPGHAHADTFNFELCYKGKPIIVDRGISTYEKNNQRKLERATSSHNTICLDGLDSSEVWDGFRVAGRAKVSLLKDDSTTIRASHNGYKGISAKHIRQFNLKKESIQISDFIESNQNHVVESHLHLHPNCEVKIEGDTILIDSKIKISLKGNKSIVLEDYSYSTGFNSLIDSKKVIIQVANSSSLTISGYTT